MRKEKLKKGKRSGQVVSIISGAFKQRAERGLSSLCPHFLNIQGLSKDGLV